MKRTLAAALLTCVSLLAGCDDHADKSTTQARIRPLHLPRLEAWASCPTKPTHEVDVKYGPAAGE
jgi:hypothetical protein